MERTPSIRSAAARLKRELRARRQDPGAFNPARYFRTTERLEFLNVRTPIVRRLAREAARARRSDWTIDEALAFTDLLLHERALELKHAGIEALAVRRRELTPRMLPAFKAWLSDNLAANWATTDTLCGTVISPLLGAHPALISRVARWATERNLWVRRASAVSLVRLAARGLALNEAYEVATTLGQSEHDLLQKAAGWLLREAGRTDATRLERYLGDHGQKLSRTAIRYALEHFAPAKRARILGATRIPAAK